MVFGYTILDPIVVLSGTAYAGYLLLKRPVHLMAFLPLSLSIYFFIPLATYLTLWQTVPLLLLGRLLVVGPARLSVDVRSIVSLLVILFIASLAYALVSGADPTRAIIRAMYYLSAFALFWFAYEMALKPDGYSLFVRGFAVVAILYGIYGAYQILAFYGGLPVRGIVYGPNSTGLIATEYGLPRINSLANEPKRLGYVMFVGALACFTLAREKSGVTRRWLMAASALSLGISLITFSGSYFLAVALFIVCALFLYPSGVPRFVLAGSLVAGMAMILGYGDHIAEALQHGFERRMEEVEVGLDGRVVYRQEFFANDFIAKHPLQAVTGVGVGQYFSVLNREYGEGVGYNEKGGLAPLNSSLLETTFDVSGIAVGLLYGSLGVLTLRLHRRGFVFLSLALLFLLIQSLTIQTLLYLAVVAGVGVAQLRVSQMNRVAAARRRLAPAHSAIRN